MSDNYAIDLKGAKRNLALIERQITADMALRLNQRFNVDAAYPFMRFQSDVYPKWLNGLVDARPDPFGTGGIDFEPVTLQTELQLGKITEGYDGKLEESLDEWLPYSLIVFRAALRLISPVAPDGIRGLLWSSVRIGNLVLPGDIIGCRFIHSLQFAAQGDGRG